MRELKFRAWIDEFTNYDDVIVPAHMSDTFTFSDFDGDYYIPEGCYLSDMHILQFTGLLDKNGKEIYEGDIVEYQNSFGEKVDSEGKKMIYGVRFIEGSFVAYQPSFEEDDIQLNLGNYLFAQDEKGVGLEVIGNVFENPNLLTN